MIIFDIFKFLVGAFVKLFLLECFCILIYGVLMGVKYLFSYRLLPDYSNKEFISIRSLKFMPYSKLPSNRDFFKKTLPVNSSAFKTKLPNIDLNDYDFDGVSISNCHFSKNTILPDDIDFFQKLNSKMITDTILPSGDYRKYNFEGVYLNRVTFPKDAIFPENYSFFKKLSNEYSFQMVLPESFNDACHLYDLSNITLRLKRKIRVSDYQKQVILYKNNNELYEFIES